MNEWYFFLTPISVLAVLLLFRFIGCASIVGLDDVHYTPKPGPPPTAEPDYPKTVADEKDSANNPILVSYWRLQEKSSTTAVPGGTAKDEKGLNDGTYKIVTLAASTPDHSPATAQPGTLNLEKQGLLEYETSSTSVEVQGGYVEVAPSLTLNIPRFTIEGLLFPMWDSSQSNFGRYYCVIESSGPLGPGAKKRGFAIYGGPESPKNATTLNTPYRWQVWLGTGAQFQQITSSSRPPALIEFNKTNYLAATYDGTTIRLYTFFAGKNIEDALSIQEPFSGYSPNAGTGVPLFIGMGLDLFPPFPTTLQQRYPFHGRIEEVAVYKIALSTERIVSHIMAVFKNL